MDARARALDDMTKRAIITGVTGQDGSYLAELLLDKGYEVVGVVRRRSTPNHWRIEHILDRIDLRPGDLLDQLSLIRLVDEVRPHELYNLAADPFEMNNLAQDPAHAERLAAMTRRMWEIVIESGDHSLFNTHYASMRMAAVGPGSSDFSFLG